MIELLQSNKKERVLRPDLKIAGRLQTERIFILVSGAFLIRHIHERW